MQQNLNVATMGDKNLEFSAELNSLSKDVKLAYFYLFHCINGSATVHIGISTNVTIN
jgi:hypothetical protein